MPSQNKSSMTRTLTLFEASKKPCSQSFAWQALRWAVLYAPASVGKAIHHSSKDAWFH